MRSQHYMNTYIYTYTNTTHPPRAPSPPPPPPLSLTLPTLQSAPCISSPQCEKQSVVRRYKYYTFDIFEGWTLVVGLINNGNCNEAKPNQKVKALELKREVGGGIMGMDAEGDGGRSLT